MSFARKARFRSDVQTAYRLICQRGMIDDGELQYILNLSHGPFYRIRKAVLAIYPDVTHENGFFKLRTLEDKIASKDMSIEFWGAMEPEKGEWSQKKD